MVSRRIRIFFIGVKKYQGNDEQICSQIINDCYNKQKKCFMVSNGHFKEFFARDFGWCTEALVSLGYRQKALDTLDYVLGTYRKHGKIMQSISSGGAPFTFPHNLFCPDALAFIIRSLKLAKAHQLVRKYKLFLNKEIKRYFNEVVDLKTGLVKKQVRYSSMKDHFARQSSCYDNVMCGMLAQDLNYFKDIINPFKKQGYNYKKLLMKYFWTGEYFLDDLSGSRHVAGDANTLPFWSGLITDRRIFRRVLASLRREKLDRPFPLKYTKRRIKRQQAFFENIILPDYETDAVWIHVGLMFIISTYYFDKNLARKYLRKYKHLILKHRNFLEVYEPDGRPFSKLVYYTDESMLWAANYLYLKKILMT